MPHKMQNDVQLNYWVIVGSRENFEKSRELGFTLQGIKSRYRRKAEQMKPGDRFIYYLTGLKVLSGIVAVKSYYREEHTVIWDCSSVDRSGNKEVYPFRFDIEPYLIPADESGFIPVTPIHRRFRYLEKWPEKNWTLGFQGNVHQWPEEDYRMVEQLFKVKTPLVLSHSS